MVARRLLAASIFVLIAGCQFSVFAQSGVSARMLFPPRNYEIALGDTLIPRVRIINTSDTTDTGIVVRYIIRNVVTNIAVISDKIIVPSLAAGDTLDTAFIPYITNPNKISELGTFNGCLIATDTECGRIFALRRTATPFFDPSENYGKTSQGDIPDQTQWCSIGATVIDGEDSTWDPPPPRQPNQRVGPDTMIAPVMRLDRKDFDENYYAGTGVGDTLTSFPINAYPNQLLSFDFMRAGRSHYFLDWDNSMMFGPETTITDSAGNVISPGDSLLLEFKNPSQPTINPSPDGWDEIMAFDGGHDFKYNTFVAYGDSNTWKIRINGVTKTLNNTPDYYAGGFRFRFRLKADNNVPNSSTIIDDADEWYVDNIKLGSPITPEVEISWVRVVNPYTKVPISQAVFPIFVHLVNSGSGNGFFPPVFVRILNSTGDTVYSDSVVFTDYTSGFDTTLQLRNWNASKEWGISSGAYTAIASIDRNINLEQFNNTETYSKFYLNIDTNTTYPQEFAMDNAGHDPAPDSGNDIPKLEGIRGEGIGFNNTSGSFAMKFHLVARDTFYGMRVLFGSANASPDYIRLSLLTGDSSSSVPQDTLVEPGVASTFLSQRGPDLNQLAYYYCPKPIPLQPGTYWIAVSQLGAVTMELGGTLFRGGAEVIQESQSAPRIRAMYDDTIYGTQWGSGTSDNNGSIKGMFAYEMPAQSGNWKSMTPDNGWWPAMDASTNMTPIIRPNLDATRWTGLGTYFPLIRPMLSSYVPPPPPPPLSVRQLPNRNLSLTISPDPFDLNSHPAEISFVLSGERSPTIAIYNVLGAAVKKIDVKSGSNSVQWDGKDESGDRVTPGIYFIELAADGERVVQKIVVQ